MSRRIIYSFIGFFIVLSGFVPVTAGEIEVLVAIEGKILVAGADFTLAWKAPDDILPYVKIDLVDTDDQLVRKISSGTPSDKEFLWNIPGDLVEGDYRFKIYTYDMSSVGTSGLFHIRALPEGKQEEAPEKPQVVRPDQNDKNNSQKTSKKQREPVAALEPKPVGAKPDAVHQGHIVTPVVTFDDVRLEGLVREMIGKPAPATIFSSDFRKISELNGRNQGINKLSGMEYFDSLITLDLGENKIKDISRLAFLKKIRYLKLDQNWIEDMSPLVKNEYLTAGATVDLSGNPIDCELQSDNIALLRKRGIKLIVDCP